MIRISKCHILLIVLILFNLALMWYFTHVQNDIPVSDKPPHNDVTIVIPFFESFENDVRSSVNQIRSLYPNVKILVLSDRIPYPYFNLPSNVHLVVQSFDARYPKHLSNPMSYIKTEYILVVPDGIRIKKNSLDGLIWQLKEQHDKPILVASVITPITSCYLLDISLERWKLKYSISRQLNLCNAFNNDVAVLFTKQLVKNFSEVFDKPFYESFFIQAKLRDVKLHVSNYSVFSLGKLLYTDPHNKWKHTEKLRRQQTELYKRIGVKHAKSASGTETWYGCTKTSTRCFPTVLDIPYYLYEDRWTPPCCLRALRETFRHVVRMLGASGVTYWLEGGSLLGAARNSDIIPWDYDIDVGVYLNNVTRSKFLSPVWKGFKKRDEKGFVWEKATEGDFIRVQYSNTNHLHVDIFPFYEKNGYMTKNTWLKTHRQDMEFPSRYLDPLQRMLFAGVMASVPNHYKDFLEMKFGPGVIENPKYPFPEKLGYKNKFGVGES